MLKFRVGVIGCGAISSNHLASLKLLENVEIVAVCDVIKERADSKASEYNCKSYTDYKQMITLEKLDSVHICLPHYLHSPVSVYALENGLDVLCEKPMDITVSAAEKMKQAAINNHKKLGVIFQNRYTSGAELVKKTLDSGKLGKIKCISAEVVWCRTEEYYEHDSWRGKWKTEGGGVLINQAIHTLDLLRYFSGSEVASVSASTSHRGETSVEVEDTSEGLIKFKNGATGLFYFTVNNTFDNSIQICVDCENGRANLNWQGAEILFNNDSVSKIDNDKKITLPGKECYGTGHYLQISEFYSDNGSLKAEFTMNEALKTQKLLEEIYISAKNDRKI